MKVCAYCGAGGVMTKEHIWPASLIKKFNELLTYNKVQNKFYKGDAVIRDVCQKCNNVVLSALDNYLSSLFDANFKKYLLPGEDAAFDYDYDLLMRVFLKVSYNAARSVGNARAVKHLKKFTKYILEGTHRGSLMLRLQVVTSSRQIDSEGNLIGMLEPELLRCGEVPYSGVLSDRFMVRLVAINCFWFFIISPYKNEPPHKWKAFLRGLSESDGMPKGVPVDSTLNRIVVPSTKTTYFHPDLLQDLRGADFPQR